MTTVCAVTPDALAVKVPEIEPLPIVIVAGTWTVELLLERLTVAPPTGAEPLRATVPVEVPDPVKVDGLNVSELTTI